MANPAHLEILTAGEQAIAAWRQENPRLGLDLAGANLSGMQCTGFDLRRANLTHAVLDGTYLSGAHLTNADLSHATGEDTRFVGTNMLRTRLCHASFTESDFSVHATRCDMSHLTLRGSGTPGGMDILGAEIRNCDLAGLRFEGANVGNSLFSQLDLSEVSGLETIQHTSPSRLDLGTLRSSAGKIPAEFLRGCGLQDWEIVSAELYARELTANQIAEIQYRVHELRAGPPILVRPLFLSYSHDDEGFVEAVESALDEQHIRYWRDQHDLQAGRVDEQIERVFALDPVILIVLSQRSVASSWVEWEVELARELERRLGEPTLCPVALDDAWKQSDWSRPLKNYISKYNVIDFAGWHNEDAFDRQFAKVLRGLRDNYGDNVRPA